jgi:hypothetical protein
VQVNEFGQGLLGQALSFLRAANLSPKSMRVFAFAFGFAFFLAIVAPLGLG